MKKYGKCGTKVGWTVRWYGKCGRKLTQILNRFGKYRRNLWKDSENMEER